MAGAEHPLVAANRANAAAHLVGQRLKTQGAVSGGQRAGGGGARARGGLALQKDVQRLPESAFQQAGIASVWNRRAASTSLPERNVESVYGVEEEQRAYPFVKVVARPAEAVESVAFGQQLGQAGLTAE